MKIRHNRGNPTIDLLRKGLPLIACTQPGLDMTNANTMIVSQQGCDHHRGGIPLNKNPIRTHVR